MLTNFNKQKQRIDIHIMYMNQNAGKLKHVNFPTTYTNSSDTHNPIQMEEEMESERDRERDRKKKCLPAIMSHHSSSMMLHSSHLIKFD